MISAHEITITFERYREDLVRFAQRRHVRCPQLAADIVQIAFVRILDQSKVSSVQHLRAYAYRTVGNLCNDYLQGLKRARRYSPLLLQSDLLRLSQTFRDPEEQMQKLQFIERLQHEVNQLPPKCRMAFTLVELQNHSIADAAQAMGINEMAVYQLIKRSYATLAQRVIDTIDDYVSIAY